MINRTLLSFILLMAIQTMAGAEMYRCELADGSVIYGDRRVNLSDDCQPVTADSAKGMKNRQIIVPSGLTERGSDSKGLTPGAAPKKSPTGDTTCPWGYPSNVMCSSVCRSAFSRSSAVS